MVIFCSLAPERQKHHRVATFHNVIPRFFPDEFRHHFRMTRITVEIVYGHISEVLQESPQIYFHAFPRKNGRKIVCLHF